MTRRRDRIETLQGMPSEPPPPRFGGGGERKKTALEALRVPHDTINEQVVIAAVLVDEAARKACIRAIRPGSFFGDGHAELWAILQELDRRGLSYDVATIRSLNAKVDEGYIEELVRQRPAAPPNLRHHIETLQWDAARIGVAQGPVMDLLEAFRDPKTTPDRMRGLAAQIGSGFGGHGTSGMIRYARDLVATQSVDMTLRRSGRAIYSFGIEALDSYEDGHPEAGRARLIPGTAPGLVTVVTGLSGSGKSTTMANSLLGYAHAKRKTLVGAWEVGSGMSLELAACIALGLDRSDMSEGLFSEQDQRDVEEKMLELGEYLVFFELPFGRGRGAVNDEQLDKIEQVVTDSGCEIFVADLFRRAIKETRPDDEEQALYRMQAMAKSTRAHFVLVQQQSIKNLEKDERKDKRPTRDNIKGSAAWVEMPDTIIGWHRPALFKNIPDDKIEACVLKQRYGKWPMVIEIDWDPRTGYLGKGRTMQADESLFLSDTEDPFDAEFIGRGKSGGKKGGR